MENETRYYDNEFCGQTVLKVSVNYIRELEN